jgi:hypothetical protein
LLHEGFSTGYVDIRGVPGRVTGLFFRVVMATILLTEALVLEGMYVGVVYLLSWYELVERVGSVRGSTKEGSEVKGRRRFGSDGFLGDTELLPNAVRYDD